MKGEAVLTNLEMNQNIADFIGSYCTQWNISAAKFAEKCGIPYMTIKRIMACNVQKIDVYTITCIAESTKTPIMEILGLDRENLNLYKRITYASSHDKTVIHHLMNILEKLHISGDECREIPFTALQTDKKSYIIDYHLFTGYQLDLSRMERISYRSTFAEGLVYFGFQIPDNRLHPYYHKGNILLVVNDDPLEGEVGVFAWKEEGYIRLVFQKVHQNDRFLELLPITGRGKKYSIDTENVSELMRWIPIGVVVGIIR